jgi:hypothetical protein
VGSGGFEDVKTMVENNPKGGERRELIDFRYAGPIGAKRHGRPAFVIVISSMATCRDGDSTSHVLSTNSP